MKLPKSQLTKWIKYRKLSIKSDPDNIKKLGFLVPCIEKNTFVS